MQQRIGWIDSLKFLAIFLVIWGHSVQQLQSSAAIDNPIFRIIYSFHMPLFMAISGFFVAKSIQKPFLKYSWDKFRQLILPLLSLGIIFFIFRNVCYQWECFENSLFTTFHPEKGYWFLKSAFICSIAFWLVSKTGRFYWPILIFTLILSQCFFLNSQFYNGYHIATMYPSFILGVQIQQNYSLLEKYSRIIVSISGTIFLLMLLFWDKSFFELKYFHDEESGKITFANSLALLYQRGFQLIIGLIGSLFFISLFKVLSSSIGKNRFTKLIQTIGGMTLGIYLLQTIFLENFLTSILNFDDYNEVVFNFFITPLLSVLVLSTCILICKLISQSKWCSAFLLGKKFPGRNSRQLAT